MKKLLPFFFSLTTALVSAQTSTGLQFPSATPAPNGGWTNPSNAFASDDVYTTVPHQSGCRCPFLYLSGDGGVTYSSLNIVGPFGTTDNMMTAGSSTDLWGTTWVDTNFTNTNFRLKIANPSTLIEQGYGNFNFSIPASAPILGIEVQVEEHGDSAFTTEYIDAIQVNVYYSTTTGIGVASSSGISVFPNPASTELTLNHLSATTQSIVLTDMTGRVVMDMTHAANNSTFNVTDLPRGMYMLVVTDSERRTLTRKIAVQ